MVLDTFTIQMIIAAVSCCAVGLGVLYIGKLNRDDQRERDAEAQARARAQAKVEGWTP